MVGQHEGALREVVYAPAKVEQKVSKTNDNDGHMKWSARLADIRKWKRSGDKRRQKGQESCYETVEEGDNATVPFGGVVAVEYTKDEVKVDPEEKATKESCQWELAHDRRVLFQQVIVMRVLHNKKQTHHHPYFAFKLQYFNQNTHYSMQGE